MIESIGDFILLACIGVAIYYVPRYLWRVYGGADWWRSIVSGFRGSREAGDVIDYDRTYVYSPPPQPVSPMIPPVSNTGISTDTRWLAENLTEAQRLEVMALARTNRGKWAYSGKKLYTVFGGNYNDFVATMKRLRDGAGDDLPEEPTVLTPIAQRPTKESHFRDPDLEYQPLP